MPQKSLSGAALERMHEVCQGVGRKMGFQLLELNGEADNIAGSGGWRRFRGGFALAAPAVPLWPTTTSKPLSAAQQMPRQLLPRYPQVLEVLPY